MKDRGLLNISIAADDRRKRDVTFTKAAEALFCALASE